MAMDKKRKTNSDEEQIQRYLNLGLFFDNRTTAVSSQEIHGRFYPTKKDDAFRKQFSRDRKHLENLGIYIEQVNKDPLWKVNVEKSYPSEKESLSPSEIKLIEILCARLVDNPAIPLSRELRYALIKISPNFRRYIQSDFIDDSPSSSIQDILQEHLDTLISCTLDYVKADGSRNRYIFKPYAFFPFRNHMYIVGERQNHDGACAIRTLKVDRIEDIVKSKSVSYTIPSDFTVTDYIYLPFQIGSTSVGATFEIPSKKKGNLKGILNQHGTFTEEGDKIFWNTNVADLRRAAMWAIDNELRPVKPQELCDIWKQVLQKVIEIGK